MKHAQETINRAACGECCIQIDALTVERGGMPILKDINLHVFCGEILAVIGPNGAGKTTLVKAVLGQIKHAGTVRYTHCGGEKKLRIGYVPQTLEFDRINPMTVADFFTCALYIRPAFFGVSQKMRAHIAQALSETGAQDLASKRMGVLSGGELQRVLLALALCNTPTLLLLDEPVSGVDQNGIAAFYALLGEIKKRHDLAIVLVSHDLRLVNQYADRIALIDGKLLECDTPQKVFASQAFENTFGFKGESHADLV